MQRISAISIEVVNNLAVIHVYVSATAYDLFAFHGQL